MSQRARALRQKPTWAEKKLWRILRDRRFSGYKFRRQHPFGYYFLDFYCAEAKLVLETDGFMHGHPDRQKYDSERDEFLRANGIKVKRIWNWQLRREIEWIRLQIWMVLQERAPHPGNIKPERPVTSRVLNPDRPRQSPETPHSNPLPVRRGEGKPRPLPKIQSTIA